MRPPLDSWRWNESQSGLGFWFEVLVGHACKMNQTLLDNFQSLSRKMWFFFVNDIKPRQIICHQKVFFCHNYEFGLITSQFITNWPKSTIKGSIAPWEVAEKRAHLSAIWAWVWRETRAQQFGGEILTIQRLVRWIKLGKIVGLLMPWVSPLAEGASTSGERLGSRVSGASGSFSAMRVALWRQELGQTATPVGDLWEKLD